MPKYFLATMLVLVSLVLVPNLVLAADVHFSEDTDLDLSGLETTTLYAKANSDCDSLTVSGSNLMVDIPQSSTFSFGPSNFTSLSLTPSGGVIGLDFDTQYLSSGQVSQWSVSSNVNSAQVSFSVKVAEANADYLVKVDGSNYGYFESNTKGVVSFNYTGGFSSKTFTITRQNRPGGGIPGGVGDTIPSSISNIEATTSDATATITWQTSEPSLTWLVYSPSTDYGFEEKGTTYHTSHSITLNDLTSETTYHYQLKSKDEAGNIGTYTDKTFTTLALEEVTEEVTEEVEEEVEEAAVEIPTVTFEKPIAEMTTKELKAKIAEISEVVSQFKALLPESEVPAIKGCLVSNFERDLSQRMSGDDVNCLQIVLNSAEDTQLAETGVGSPGNETNYFGPLTKAAMIRFQEKYAEDVLESWNLTSGTGYVGSTSCSKLNQLLKSKDEAGNIGTYTDKTFTTLVLGEVIEAEEEAVEIPTVTFEKPIAEMTTKELKAKIAEISEVVSQLKALLPESEVPAIKGCPVSNFERDLSQRMSGDDVNCLQIVLNSDEDTQLAETGPGSPGNETNYFGPLTKAAVIRFQEKYAEDVLESWNLTSGTGYVGSTSCSKLNQLLK